MRICESCGMPMEGAKDHGGHDESNSYCKYCTNTKGELKSREQVRDGMVAYMVKSEKRSREEAERFVEQHLSQMPAWKKAEAESS